MADTRPASETSGVGEAPWPVLPQPSETRPSCSPPEGGAEDGAASPRGTLVRVIVLVVLVGVVTAAGIAIGRAVSPSHPAAATTAPPATTSTPPHAVVHRVTYAWGPLTVQPYGK